MRRRLLWLVMVACLTAPITAAGQEATDPFAAMHGREVAGNEPGRRVTIRTKDGRTSFQPREPIEIELTITPGNGVNPDTRVTGCGFQMTEAVFDQPANVSTPLAPVLCPPPGETISAGIVGGFMAGERPWTMTFLLNGPYRIDRSGRLRLFMRSRHTHLDDTARHETSNIVTLDIQPRDRAWEADVERAAAAVLDDAAAPREAVGGALRSLATLATPGAARALLRHFDAQRERPPLQALFAVDDRAATVRLMEEEVRQAARPVDGEFVSLLAQLARADRHPDGVSSHDELLALMDHYAVMRASALMTASTSRLRDALLADLERSTEWESELRGPVAGAIDHFLDDTAAAMRQLGSVRVERLLRNNPRRFSRIAFIPLLRQLYATGSPAVADLALRYLFAAAPDEGRTLILDALARPVPRVRIETLGRLPDATLPRLEHAWIRLLEARTHVDAAIAAAQRLERFGTGAGASRVAAWRKRHHEWPPEIDAPVIAYLARVDQPLAERLIAVATAEPARLRGADDDETLPLAMGRLEWNATVERFAVASLSSRDAVVAGQAATALAAYGSPEGRTAIQAALHRRQAAWPRVQSEEAATLEGDLARALVSGVNWRLDDGDRASARAGCRGDMCAYHLQAPSRQTVESMIAMSTDAEAQQATLFVLDDVELTSVPALIAKLRQYPAGTRFYFDPLQTQPRPLFNDWSERERQTLFDDVKAGAARFGIVVSRQLTPIRRDQTVR
jgi:hypothetical protein